MSTAKPKKDTAINTIIGEDTVINGNVKLTGNIVIYGKVIGDVETQGMIRIGPGAEIKGKLNGNDLQVGGYVQGNIISDGKLTLGDKSVLHGDVRVTQIIIEEGAHFEGKCEMQGQSSARAELSEKEENAEN